MRGMTEPVQLALIAAVPTLVSSVSLLVLRGIKISINSRMTELLEITRNLAHAQGLAEGKATGQQ